MGTLLVVSLGAILIENFVLSRFLGICAFLGVSKKLDTALGMGMAVTFVMTVSTVITWMVQRFILDVFDLQYLQTIVFILVIAVLVQLIEMFLKKAVPSLYTALGIYLPLITTNCAVLGVTILIIDKNYDLFTGVIFAISAAIGFTLALVIFSGIRERLQFCNVPKAFHGIPIALVAASLLAMAFMGFQGLKLPL